jgi:hypothetical protein
VGKIRHLDLVASDSDFIAWNFDSVAPGFDFVAAGDFEAVA